MFKAYDRVGWSFLEKVLAAFGFPQQWVKLIMQCVTTVKISILVNDEPSPAFIPMCGLRQGDPISPYLFLLCLEVL